MRQLDERISGAILDAYYRKLSGCVEGDVLIVGAGPAGLTAAMFLAGKKMKVVVVEKRLAPGGGVWGGGMAMNEAVVQDKAIPVLRAAGVRHRPLKGGLHIVDAMEMASGLCLKAIQSGAVVLNLTTVEDVFVRDGRVKGVVVNRSVVSQSMPIDPITLAAEAVIDATGHEAGVVAMLQKRDLLGGLAEGKLAGEAPMDAEAGEEFVVERVAEVHPGLWVAGMSVCAVFGGPRMGPIFGGMLLSGKRVAELILAETRAKRAAARISRRSVRGGCR